MRKQKLLVASTALLLTGGIHAQNVGIGINTPLAKLHIEQPAGADGVLINQTNTSGNSLEITATNAANADITFFLQNATAGASVVALSSNTASNASNIISANQGLGSGLDVRQLNTGNSLPGVLVTQSGTGPLSRGVNVEMQTGSVGIGTAIFQNGLERGLYVEVLNTTTTASVSEMYQRGLGIGSYVEVRNPANANIGSVVFHAGTGRGSAVQINNAASTAISNGVYHLGLGIGQEVQILNTASTAVAELTVNDGLGRGQEIELTSLTNAEVGEAIFHRGNGFGQYVTMSNTNADRNSIGLFIDYNGTGATGGGGGNAVEIQHNGTNGNGLDLFMGDPVAAAGPANTTNSFTALSIAHMATGTSGATNNKSAIDARNNSADPTAVFNNQGPNNGEGVNVFINPITAAGALSAGIYSQAQVGTNGFGVGVWGQGGNYGVVGATGGTAATNYGVFSVGNSGASGTKTFLVDYPLDPANKKLRHFSIESDEILNLYRGMVTLDANGEAIVELPVYFDVVNNTNISYQLTGVGSAVQPYVKSEVNNNQFVVAGAPNSKVSWTLYSERNDPTLKYFEQMAGPDYRSPVTDKASYERGKYYTPQAYGQDATKGIFYSESHEVQAQKAQTAAKRQQAAQPLQPTAREKSKGLTPRQNGLVEPATVPTPKQLDLTDR